MFSILTNIVILTLAANIQKEDSWIVNIGGKISMCNNLNWFNSYTPYKEYVKSRNTSAFHVMVVSKYSITSSYYNLAVSLAIVFKHAEPSVI
jgi:hypothetical protein